MGRLARTWLLIGATAIAIGLLEQWVAGSAQNHPWRWVIGLTIGGLVAGAVWFVFGRLAAAALAALLAAAAFGLVDGWDTRDNYLTPYCSYDARTQAQLDACLREVGSDEIDELDTPAARFARGELTECGRGSGPYCDAPGVE